MGDSEGWDTYWNLGAIEASHPPSDWDGHVVTARSGGDEGRWFEVQYRLCAGSCDETGFPPPLLALSHGREDLLIWQWNGGMSRLAGYSVYMDGSRIMRMRGTTNVATMDIGRYAPLCGGQHMFHVVAYGADGRESPPSNTVVWEAEACPRVVRVTFERLSTYDTTDQENDCLGPIFGNFWVEGSESHSLRIRGRRLPRWLQAVPPPSLRHPGDVRYNSCWHGPSGPLCAAQRRDSPGVLDRRGRILQSSEPVGEIGGMLFVLDPSGAIPDGNKSNNTFETPVVLRVEFLEVGGRNCSETSCSIFDCDSEFMFQFWVGYGPSESDISWVAYRERFPPHGDLVACAHNACMGHDSPDEDWILEGDERYAFEVEMSAVQNLDDALCHRVPSRVPRAGKDHRCRCSFRAGCVSGVRTLGAHSVIGAYPKNRV